MTNGSRKLSNCAASTRKISTADRRKMPRNRFLRSELARLSRVVDRTLQEDLLRLGLERERLVERHARRNHPECGRR